MNLFVNGESASAAEGTTVQTLLEQMGLPQKGLAVERNREIVPRSLYATTRIADGDRIEIVQFVGGG